MNTHRGREREGYVSMIQLINTPLKKKNKGKKN